jgi:hypothetical protein
MPFRPCLFTKAGQMSYNRRMSDQVNDLGLKCRNCKGALHLAFG